ncbi:MAG TPA: M28 family peptidase [Terriglobales bacterium]|nr:M28 family peptidase [Terriglobales bacterium]
MGTYGEALMKGAVLFSFAVFVMVLLGSWPLPAQTLHADAELSGIVQRVRAEVNSDQAMDVLVGLYEKDRWGDFAAFQQSAKYLERTMTTIGLRDVELLSAPADGSTQFGFWTMPLAWDVKQARLEIVEPVVPADTRVLADYSKVPASLIMWSGATPPGGITAEVVELRPATVEKLKRLDVKGKMVLAEPPLDLAQRGMLKAMLYKMGAAGVMSYATENPELANSHYWMNAWGDSGWGFTKTGSPLVGFSITPGQGAYLSNLLTHGTKVQVKAIADTRYYAGRYPYVTGVIAGTEPGEEVLELGHGFEVGAQDNATGVAGMLEAVATLQRLINAGKLPRPRRSIRILVMPEDYGSSAYIDAHLDRMRQTIGAVCVDTPAGRYEESAGYGFAMNPDVNRSYQDALILRVAENYYAGLPQRFPRWSRYRPTSDSYLSDPAIGVPTIAVTGSSGAVNVHHNSADTLERVDQRSVRDLSAVLASHLYYLASAGEREIPWLAQITLDRSYENATRVAAPYLERIAAATDADALGRELHLALAHANYNADRDRDAVLSLVRLATPASREKIRLELNPYLHEIDRFADQHSEKLQRAADERAAALGYAVPVRAIAPAPDPSRVEAARLVVRRKRFGPITLDDLPVEQREGYPGFGGNPAPLPLLTWCDGKRTVAEVIRLVELEYGPMRFDFVGYFKFLAKHGYIDLVSTP